MKTVHRCLILLMLLALPAAVQAQFNYTTNNNTITISQYTGAGGNVIIPDFINGLKVATVGSAAFFQIAGLTAVTFGTNVTTIAANAVFQCPNITSVLIPASVTNIGQGPFIDCKSLTTISVNPSNSFYTNVSQVLFSKGQTSLLEFPGGVGGAYTIPATVTNVGQAFIGNSLTSISVNSGNTIYTNLNGVLCSKNKTQLISYPGGAPGSYVVPTNITTIVSAAFEYSTGVTDVTIGTNVTSIGLFAFFDCANLNSLAVNATNAFYSSTNGVLFDKKKNLLIQYPSALAGTYSIPATVTNIGDGAFADSINLTSVVIPNSVTNIGQQAFYFCPNLTSVAMSKNVKNIDQSAFFLCSGLSEMVFPASLTNLGQFAFGGCQNLASVCFEGNQPIDGGSVFYFDNALSTILYVNGATGWGATFDGIPTAVCATCNKTAPSVTIVSSGANVVVTWPASFNGYTLLSTTNLTPPTVWLTNSTVPVLVNTNYVVTNTATGPRKFFRLVQ